MSAGVQTDLTNIEDWQNDRLNEIVRLIGEHCKFEDLKAFHRPISLAEGKFPACYVQPRIFDPTLDSIAIYNHEGEVTLYVYHTGNSVDRVGADTMATSGILNKLFSRNALNDLGTAAPTARYFAHPPFWVMSKFGPVQTGEVIGFQKDTEQLFLVAARIVFKFSDYVLP